MSNIDPEVLYLILTKVARKEPFYGYDAAQQQPIQKPGTISSRELALVYERVTGNRVGSRLNWKTPLEQLNLLLSHCGLPAIGKLVLLDQGPEPTPEALDKVQGTQWPAFGALRNLYRK